MRIIAGEFRGRKILPPEGQGTRPVTDRAKQSIFDVLGDQVVDAVVYDCFAGTGSFGLETLSRGAKHSTFFESDRSAIRLLRQNIGNLSLDIRSTIMTTDVFRQFTDSRRKDFPSPPADIIFFDPPYLFLEERTYDLQRLLQMLTNHFLAPHGLIVFRHDRRDLLDLPELRKIDHREYGNMYVEFLSAVER